MGLSILWDERTVYLDWTPTLTQQGALGIAHGGSIAAVLDELTAAAANRGGKMRMTTKLEVKFLRPIPVGQLARARGWVGKTEGRTTFAHGEIVLPSGEVAATATATTVDAPQMVAHMDHTGLAW